jgi:hypothetical protein
MSCTCRYSLRTANHPCPPTTRYGLSSGATITGTCSNAVKCILCSTSACICSGCSTTPCTSHGICNGIHVSSCSILRNLEPLCAYKAEPRCRSQRYGTHALCVHVRAKYTFNSKKQLRVHNFSEFRSTYDVKMTPIRIEL